MSAVLKKFHRLVFMAAALAALTVTVPAIAGGVSPNPQDAAADQAHGADQLIIEYRKGTAAEARGVLQTMSDAHTKVNRADAQMKFLRRNTAGSYVMKLDRELDRRSIDALALFIAANIVQGYDMIIDTLVSSDGDGRESDASDPGDWTTAGLRSPLSGATNSSWHGTHVAQAAHVCRDHAGPDTLEPPVQPDAAARL
jgi:hypothetical protein